MKYTPSKFIFNFVFNFNVRIVLYTIYGTRSSAQLEVRNKLSEKLRSKEVAINQCWFKSLTPPPTKWNFCGNSFKGSKRGEESVFLDRSQQYGVSKYARVWVIAAMTTQLAGVGQLSLRERERERESFHEIYIYMLRNLHAAAKRCFYTGRKHNQLI